MSKYIPDYNDAFNGYETEQERAERAWIRKLPRCSKCGEPIRDEDCWVIGDEIYCEYCIDEFKDYTENHMEE